MLYRKLGKTGMQASIIGLGTEHLDNKEYEIVEETIGAAMDYDINIMDLFMPGHDVRQKIGRAIKGNRKNFIIQGHIGATDLSGQYDTSRDIGICKKYFENLMIDLGTDYIDLGMLYYVDNEEEFNAVFNSDIVRYAEELKKAGTIRAIGASSHDPIMALKMVKTGVIEMLMFSVNPAFDMVPAEIDALDYLLEGFDKSKMLKIDEKRMELYKTCEKLDIPITVMKTLGGGKLISAEHTPFTRPLTVNQCIHYALTRPAAASVLVGCQSRSQVEEAVSYLNAQAHELDYSETISEFSKDFRGSCVYCNHCLPCPAQIDVAMVTKCLDIAVMDSDAANMGIGRHYRSLNATGSDCTQCGSCEPKCPFGVSVVENMKKAAEIFGK